MNLTHLTDRQLSTLDLNFNLGKKPWNEKTNHLLKLIQSFQNVEGVCLQNMQQFKEAFEYEIKRRKVEHFRKSQEGTIQSKFTPCDKAAQEFDKVRNPKMGEIYHVSWAFKGAKFKLKRIEGNLAYLDNPKYKRKELLKAKLEDLRALR
ncbi:MAG: hypothetical protein AAF620_15240 [Bacteroidota bacterium]